ncbi:RDD family protein [Psychroserpens sp. SPM9]|uniref:RDD family protein n=1 Tax=Psychroserpens sp. SPM9 TaxID=2975598 RepID=UPI0021A8D506|nr:RDD family protein [Psychroserpens sp. SPM9]MDG5489938.1 RDD family protein [Psychroserpens sp. SPM9]
MKITHQKYPEHHLANETERGENLGIDFILSSILGVGAVVIYFLIIDDYEPIPFKIKATAFLIYLAVRFAYYFCFEAIYGRTPGKFQTQTKVVDKHGNKPNLFQLLIRNLVRFISVLSGISDDERAIHDSASNTFVVQDSQLKRIESRQPMIVLFNLLISVFWIYYLTRTAGKSAEETALLIALILTTVYAIVVGFRRIGKKSNLKKYR